MPRNYTFTTTTPHDFALSASAIDEQLERLLTLHPTTEERAYYMPTTARSRTRAEQASELLQRRVNQTILSSATDIEHPPRLPDLPQDLNLVTCTYNSDRSSYLQYASQAYSFFRQTASRYSPATLNAIAYISDNAHDGTTADLPQISVAQIPYHYDDESEIKFGGIIGMRISWPGKTVLTVHPQVRRSGIGTLLVSDSSTPLKLWVGRTNIAAQIFLLSRGFYAEAFNRNGAVLYSRNSDDAEGS